MCERAFPGQIDVDSIVLLDEEAFRVYFDVAKLLFSNVHDELVEFNRVYSFYLRGISLWKRLYLKWLELTSTCSQLADFTDINLPGCLVYDRFLEFAQNHANLDGISRFSFNIGEGDALKHAEPERILQLISPLTVDILCGPIMTTGDKVPKDEWDCLNDFLAKFLRLSETSPRGSLTFSLWTNKFISLTEGFAGYFHSYVVGDAVLFETMHKLCADAAKNWYFIVDQPLALELTGFFDDYRLNFARRLNTESHDKDSINAILDELETYTSRAYRNRFDGDFLDNLVTFAKLY